MSNEVEGLETLLSNLKIEESSVDWKSLTDS